MFTSAVRCLPHSDFAGYPASCRIRDIWPDMDYGQWLDTGFLAVWYFTTYKIINTHLAFFISSTFLASVSKRPKCIRYTGTIRDSASERPDYFARYPASRIPGAPQVPRQHWEKSQLFGMFSFYKPFSLFHSLPSMIFFYTVPVFVTIQRRRLMKIAQVIVNQKT